MRHIADIARDMVSGARRTDLPVGDCTATVLEAEGAVQLIWHRNVPGALAGQSLFNDFTSPGMGDQLRALADAVDAAEGRRDDGFQ